MKKRAEQRDLRGPQSTPTELGRGAQHCQPPAAETSRQDALGRAPTSRGPTASVRRSSPVRTDCTGRRSLPRPHSPALQPAAAHPKASGSPSPPHPPLGANHHRAAQSSPQDLSLGPADPSLTFLL
ncbi:PREDICTED: formin-like protein 6 [Chinchilla lanigera]|uniref:formin-like protein 6 n=1 Tax=Chinchilla lanigera TaxID=34839 RepID=UPI000695EC2A|nr:PREDICTED: formin-like protein 6 [Chinchilla lanigera]